MIYRHLTAGVVVIAFAMVVIGLLVEFEYLITLGMWLVGGQVAFHMGRRSKTLNMTIKVVEVDRIDEDDPKNHPIDCTCIMCIPGA